MSRHIVSTGPLKGLTQVPGDKSISHRALIFAALSQGTTTLENLSGGEDVHATANCLRALGVSIEEKGDRTVVHGVGLDGLRPADEPLDCGNSGTTMRLLAGVLAGSGVGGVLDGDESLGRRPMRRILSPLRSMGAVCHGSVKDERGEEYAPLRFAPHAWLVGRDHALEVASAQVKTALLLAGLWADGITRVKEPIPSRDHTERMLEAMGVDLVIEDGTIGIRRPAHPLHMPPHLEIPGDPSSAAFLIAAAAMVPESVLTVRGVNGNPTRTGFFRVLERMGADLRISTTGEAAGDRLVDLEIRWTPNLSPVEVGPDEIPSMVDEIPLLAVIATRAEGRTVIRGAQELRVKESDRLATITEGLERMGARIEETADGLEILGPTDLRGAAVEAHGDHRIAMSLAVAALAASGPTELDGADWADVSFPGFYDLVDTLTRGNVPT